MPLSPEMYTGDSLQTLIEKVDRILAESRPISANCAELMRGYGEDAETCRLATFEQCSENNCQMAICEKHAVKCANCGQSFCWPDYQVHTC